MEGGRVDRKIVVVGLDLPEGVDEREGSVRADGAALIITVIPDSVVDAPAAFGKNARGGRGGNASCDCEDVVFIRQHEASRRRCRRRG